MDEKLSSVVERVIELDPALYVYEIKEGSCEVQANMTLEDAFKVHWQISEMIEDLSSEGVYAVPGIQGPSVTSDPGVALVTVKLKTVAGIEAY